MPFYNYHCWDCDKEFEELQSVDRRQEHPCPICGEPAQQEPSTPRVVLFRSGLYEHTGPDPVWCDTPQDLQDACNKHGGISQYLENSNFKVRKNYDQYEEGREKERIASRSDGDPTLRESS